MPSITKKVEDAGEQDLLILIDDLEKHAQEVNDAIHSYYECRSLSVETDDDASDKIAFNT